VRPYAGVAWEHEFNGKGKVTTNGLPIEAASLKGSSGVAEVGVSIGRKNVRTTHTPATGNVNAGTANANTDMGSHAGASDRAPSQTPSRVRSTGIAYVITGDGSHNAQTKGGAMVDANARAGTSLNANVGSNGGNAVALGVGANADATPQEGEAGMSTSGNWTFDFTVTAYTGNRRGAAGTAKFVYQW
ncbi:MAG: hypothetical protein LBG61_07055, partial [Burkholderiales bacterium]|jgi:hypothetical protein|nr:hypothetical protein [Burkholderiales bacterium]